MDKIKIYASAVTNLTDARYFAAREVDIIGFNLDDIDNFLTVLAMMEWVEGPQFYLETSAPSLSQALYEEIRQAGITTLLVPPFFEKKDGFNYLMKEEFPESTNQNGTSIISVHKSFEALTNIEKNHLKISLNNTNYLDIAFAPANLDTLILELEPYGLVLRGGDEEKLGVKSYDDLDEILDAIQWAG